MYFFACADAVKPHKKIYFPPELEMLQALAELFRSNNAFSNYLGYVRTGCMISRADHAVRVASMKFSEEVASCVPFAGAG